MTKSWMMPSVALAVALASAPAWAQDPTVAEINASASSGCWAIPNSDGGTGWQWNGTNPGTVSSPAGTFAGANTVTYDNAQLVDATRRALENPGGGGYRYRFALACNAPTVATLTAANGSFRSNDYPTLPTGASAAGFRNSFAYHFQFALVNKVNATTPTGILAGADIVDGGAAVRGNVAPSAGVVGLLATGPGNLATLSTDDDWVNLRRLDLRLQLASVANLPSQSVRPVMVAGAYSETFTITITPTS